ncbi:hypothetical protein C8J57DRAFT_1076918 [Mycena rebaudengoi]|nr:hypothetical protein C8J57DRAFT_1076918 [Mycena rebaudengoi]
MVYRAKSKRQQEKEDGDRQEKWMQRAIKIHQEGHGSSSQPVPSYADCIEQAQAECLAQEGRAIALSKSTLQRRAKGGKTRREAHEFEGWLTKDEAQTVISFTIECADRGFPLSHRRLKEHVIKLRVHAGETSFPSLASASSGRKTS